MCRSPTSVTSVRSSKTPCGFESKPASDSSTILIKCGVEMEAYSSSICFSKPPTRTWHAVGTLPSNQRLGMACKAKRGTAIADRPRKSVRVNSRPISRPLFQYHIPRPVSATAPTDIGSVASDNSPSVISFSRINDLSPRTECHPQKWIANDIGIGVRASRPIRTI